MAGFQVSINGRFWVSTEKMWLWRLHFGRYGGLPMKTAWAVLGLAPVALFVTGAIIS